MLALGKQRIMPHGAYSQQVICKQQDQLIQRLRHIELDRLLIEVLKKLTTQLLNGGPTSGLGTYLYHLHRNTFSDRYLSLSLSFINRNVNSPGIGAHAHIGSFSICVAVVAAR